jgi:superfamily II DNA or RNA helicase
LDAQSRHAGIKAGKYWNEKRGEKSLALRLFACKSRYTTMSLLIPIEAFDKFKEVKDFPVTEILPDAFQALVKAVKDLDEREEFEPWLRSILVDGTQTPHGPAEIVDILTPVTARGQHGMAAFILKGKSFSTVRPADVGHQIYRLKKIEGLKFAVFAAPGTILDAAKEQFCATCEEIGCHYSVFHAEDLVRLFVAYGFFCPRDGNRIISGRCRSCGYSPNKRILNLLQKEALEGLSIAHGQRKKSGLVVLPPGSGKTRVAAEDAIAVNAQRVLYVAHTHEILDVALSEFGAKFGAACIMRLDKASSLNNLNRVNLVTIALLARHLEKFSAGQFDYLVIDEFHHAAAVSYRRVLEKLSPPFLLGLTATPFRGDQQNILQLCNNTIIVSHALRFGIETGVLCPYHYFGCFDDVDYSQIQHSGFSYDIRDLERALIVPERDQAIIRKWREKAEGKATIAFCCSINHAKRVVENFVSAGIRAVAYTSAMNVEQRENALNRFKGSEVSVLCVVDVLNEGADLPFVECLLFLRPTESKRIFFQQLGRGLRRYAGKAQCIVIDFIGNFKNANRIVEYQGLLPFGETESGSTQNRQSYPKNVLNLPLGCQVTFDDRVIELFYDQTLDTSFISNHNIRRILMFQYDRLARRLGHPPTKKELDRNCVIGSNIYATCFGSWRIFEETIANETT